jgi:hypothetical protein
MPDQGQGFDEPVLSEVEGLNPNGADFGCVSAGLSDS